VEKVEPNSLRDLIGLHLHFLQILNPLSLSLHLPKFLRTANERLNFKLIPSLSMAIRRAGLGESLAKKGNWIKGTKSVQAVGWMMMGGFEILKFAPSWAEREKNVSPIPSIPVRLRKWGFESTGKTRKMGKEMRVGWIDIIVFQQILLSERKKLRRGKGIDFISLKCKKWNLNSVGTKRFPDPSYIYKLRFFVWEKPA